MKNTYKEKREALLKEAEESKEAIKENVTSGFSLGGSKGKKVLLVLGGAVAAYGLVNLYFKNYTNVSEEGEKKQKIKNPKNKEENVKEPSFINMIKKEVSVLLVTFFKELLSELVQRVKHKDQEKE